MKAVVFEGVGEIGLEEVSDPSIQQPTDAIVRLSASAICGTDLHFVRGSMPGMVPGTILGHEGIGTVEDVGDDVRNFRSGDRVVITSTIGCGACSYCRAGYYSQCDVANPNGSDAGTCFFGGPQNTGPIDGLQAEYARVPYAHTTMVRLPDAVSDDDAILLSDIMPTAWFGGRLAEIRDGDTVAVFGAGIVGQLAMLAAREQGAGRVLAVDCRPDRLDRAAEHGAEPINFDEEDPVETIKRLTGGIGVDRVIDAVGVDAEHPHHGPAQPDAEHIERFEQEQAEVAPEINPKGDQWRPGDAPSQVADWAVEAVAKAGTIGIIGVYPPAARSFPLGEAMNKNLTINMGNCNHRRYVPQLIDLVASGAMRLAPEVSQASALPDVVSAYEAFDRREPGWLKVALAAS
jgi:threonine dehydrogenase-like Zn-dependent dehydrogenase